MVRAIHKYVGHRHWAFAGLLILLYNDWILAPILNPHMSLTGSLISEISARTQPYHSAFQFLDITAGLLTLALAPWVWRFVRFAKVPLAIVLFIGFIFVGIDSIADALLPISCAPSLDQHCQLAASHSIITTMHLVESTLAGIAEFVAPLIWGWQCRRDHRTIMRLNIGFVGTQLAVGASILLLWSIHNGNIGLLQRAYELSIGIWVGLTFGICVERRRFLKEKLSQPPQIENLTAAAAQPIP